MNHLRYASNEMFSSTQLIRQSKQIFDKLNTKEIEKAIILRDGKPTFMLLDFETYENIMNEYLKLKQTNSLNIQTTVQNTIQLTEPKDDTPTNTIPSIEKEDISIKTHEDTSNAKGEIKEFWN